MGIYEHIRMHPYGYLCGLAVVPEAMQLTQAAQILGEKLAPGLGAAAPLATFSIAGFLFAVPLVLALWLDHQLRGEFPRIVPLADCETRTWLIATLLVGLGVALSHLVQSAAVTSFFGGAEQVIPSRYVVAFVLLAIVAVLPLSLAAALMGRAAIPRIEPASS